MRKFTSESLAPSVESLRSAIGRLGGEIWKQSDAAGPMVPYFVDATRKALDQLESAFSNRGELDARSDILGPQFAHARHCLKRVAELAACGAEGELHGDAHAFLLALQHAESVLKAIAEELDAEYTTAAGECTGASRHPSAP